MNSQHKLKKLSQSEVIKSIYDNNASWFHEHRDKSLYEKTWLDEFIKLLPDNSEILDVGCGSGDPISRYMIENELSVTGIDFSKKLIQIAKAHYPNSKWMVEDMRDFKLSTKFDGIITWNSFFHLDHKGQLNALDSFKNHLKQGGVLMFTAGPDHGEVLGRVNEDEVCHSSFSLLEYREELSKRNLKLIKYKLKDPECRSHSIYLAKS